MAKTIARLRPLTPPSTNGNGAGERRQSVELASPTRRKPSWVLLGALLVGFSALLGAWIFTSNSERTSVMVAARDIDPGEVIDSTDLRAVEVGGSTGLRAIQPSQQELIVGRAARGPIPAGTVVNTDLFVDVGQSIPAGLWWQGRHSLQVRSPSPDYGPGTGSMCLRLPERQRDSMMAQSVQWC